MSTIFLKDYVNAKFFFLWKNFSILKQNKKKMFSWKKKTDRNLTLNCVEKKKYLKDNNRVPFSLKSFSMFFPLCNFLHGFLLSSLVIAKTYDTVIPLWLINITVQWWNGRFLELKSLRRYRQCRNFPHVNLYYTGYSLSSHLLFFSS